MLKNLFKKKTIVNREPVAQAQAMAVDGDETIVINLTGEESVTPDEIRLEIEEPLNGSAPEPQCQPVASEPAGFSHSMDDGDKTQVWTGTDALPAVKAGDEPFAGVTDATADAALTAGCLLVTEGKGCGTVLPLRLGRNRIGRSSQNEVTLNNGDPAISKENHLTIAADPKTRRYYAMPGDSTNLAYIDEEPLLGSREIADKAIVQLGHTKLAFVQFLGTYVEWS